MNWTNVRLILAREIRDQLRDRRTMFMVAVLPLLLYPLLGMAFFQVAQFMREQEMQVLVLGADELDALSDFPPLITDSRFDDSLFSDKARARLLQLDVRRRVARKESADEAVVPTPAQTDPASDFAQSVLPEPTPEQIEQDLRDGKYQAVLEFPKGYADRMLRFRDQLTRHVDPKQPPVERDRVEWDKLIPKVDFDYNLANEKSQVTHGRLRNVLDSWKSKIVEQNLELSRIPNVAADPFRLNETDVAEEHGKRIAIWSKLLPFVLIIWALVGAFYPAVDLCAGEKERGTLETLLSSPAERIEIVWGKLFTVMLFSVANAVLNLLAMGVTGMFIIGQLNTLITPGGASRGISPPPLDAVGWLLLGLLPVAALFSALSLALASFARSSKEGQYYLMPLVLVTTPLMFLPMAGGFELNLGNSLIPVTGVMLLLRSLLEGNYSQAALHAPIVIAVTLGCCWLAIRWAVDQFNKESVLFRESERLDLGLWLRRLVRDRGLTPSIAEAVACAILILIIRFFMTFALTKLPMNSFGDFALMAFISQVVVIGLPALLMTILLTRSPAKTLLVDRLPRLSVIPATLLLVVVWHPINVCLGNLVETLYPLNPEAARQLNQAFGLLGAAPVWWLPFVLIALLPALCEEFAFRGFILSGLRHIGHKWWAITLAAVFFGVAHSVLQQSLVAVLTGCVIGYLAVQTGSLVPCFLFHLAHNSLTLVQSMSQDRLASFYEDNAWAPWLLTKTTEGGEVAYTYAWPLVLLCAVLAAGLLYWFSRQPYEKTAEEALQDALDHQAAPAASRI